MNDITRRGWLRRTGAAVGATVLAGCDYSPEASPAQAGQSGSQRDLASWTYARLDPERVAEKVYQMYPEGGCMYALFGGILFCENENAKEPFPTFPLHMMKYGAGGVGGWGTICGALNGAAAVIGLFVGEKQYRERLITDLFSGYESMSLPKYRPATSVGQADVVATTSRSVLCHVSVGTWCHASGCTIDSKEKTERCRRLTVDVAMKTVELLNEHCSVARAVSESTSARPAASESGAKQPPEVMGKMRCDTCHRPEKNHAKAGGLLGK
jgi:hypothetical protein